MDHNVFFELENGLSYTKIVSVDGDSVTTEYVGISEKHWRTIYDITEILAENGIGPHMLETDAFRNEHWFTLERVFVLTYANSREIMREPDFKVKLISLLAKLRSLNICHGDILGNLGVTKNGDVVLIDVDSAFFIGQSDELLKAIAKARYDYGDLQTAKLEARMCQNDINSIAYLINNW